MILIQILHQKLPWIADDSFKNARQLCSGYLREAFIYHQLIVNGKIINEIHGFDINL